MSATRDDLLALVASLDWIDYHDTLGPLATVDPALTSDLALVLDLAAASVACRESQGHDGFIGTVLAWDAAVAALTPGARALLRATETAPGATNHPGQAVADPQAPERPAENVFYGCWCRHGLLDDGTTWTDPHGCPEHGTGADR